MRKSEIAFAVFLVAVSAVYGGMALGMPRGHIAYPGPGFFPVLVGGFLLLAALACLIQAALLMPLNGAAPHVGPPRAYSKAAQLLAWLVGYGIALKPLGFPIALLLFVFAAIRIFGYRRWVFAAGIAAALTVLSYVVFVAWLKVPLPTGPLGEILQG